MIGVGFSILYTLVVVAVVSYTRNENRLLLLAHYVSSESVELFSPSFRDERGGILNVS